MVDFRLILYTLSLTLPARFVLGNCSSSLYRNVAPKCVGNLTSIVKFLPYSLIASHPAPRESRRVWLRGSTQCGAHQLHHEAAHRAGEGVSLQQVPYARPQGGDCRIPAAQ